MAQCSVDACDRPTVGRGWCRRHYHRWMRHGDPEGGACYRDGRIEPRFWAKVERGASCWEWTGARDAYGYGFFRVDSETSMVRPHRWAYEHLRGRIPDGLVLDHLCRNPSCVNPDHLEIVTQAENTRRGNAGINMASKTHCPQGHAYEGENLYVSPSGRRHCRTCGRDAMKRYRAKKSAITR
jgi:hypothetical protein